jgi:hypothetical protein
MTRAKAPCVQSGGIDELTISLPVLEVKTRLKETRFSWCWETNAAAQ